MEEQELRNIVVATGPELLREGLVARTWGNISARVDDTHYLITPSGMDYEQLSATACAARLRARTARRASAASTPSTTRSSAPLLLASVVKGAASVDSWPSAAGSRSMGTRS